MNRIATTALLLSIASLSGCGGAKYDANESNLRTAVTRFLEMDGDVCVSVGRWPVDVSEVDMRLRQAVPGGIANRMAALEAVGLARSAEEQTEVDGFGKTVRYKVRRYTLTAAAKPFLRAGGDEGQDARSNDLCWARKGLDRLIRWQGPVQIGGRTGLRVTYTYRVESVADWVRDDAVQAAFSEIAQVLAGAGKSESKLIVEMTQDGWEARGVDSDYGTHRGAAFIRRR